MFLPVFRHGLSQDGKLPVPYPTYESARAIFPSDREVALRAFIRSEAARFANALILPRRRDPEFDGVVALFHDPEWARIASVRSRRFDLVVMLLREGRFARRVAARLVRQGKIGAETARAVA